MAAPGRYNVSGVVASDGNFYLMGGFDAANNAVPNNDMYNAATNTWTSRAPLPVARSNAAIGTLGNAIYLAGGDVSGVHGGTVSQQGSVSGLPIEVVVALMVQYRAALIEMDPGSREQAELVLANLEREIGLPKPDTTAASRHLEMLKAIAQRAVISAASGTGTKLVSALLKSWPF